ncbi:phosphoglycerate mutase [Kangiella profundi]|uniref:Phosphoglycerate mutase n=1 Tax=Kangiella profundi TaxID=1561924 RepID=A0A2K9AQR3_9GAMM|nr:histidine phosphatase family protein [Kangiella profundi]AUD78753.1 phosphoglycerate mutase [Kangiella profundi]GGF04500.1 hypothetical protein GCM10011356_17710 [Kangiella profundi]
MNPLKTVLLVSSLLSSFSLFAEETAACQNYEVFVMRHLPKEVSHELPPNKDPELSILGKKMAIQLAELSFMNQIDAAFSTDYLRTRQSINPSAQKYDFDVYSYDPRNNQLLVERVYKEFCGKSIMIIGHSNTVPSLVTSFGGSFEVSFAGENLNHDTEIFLAENDYGTIFHVKKEQGKVQQKLIKMIQ